MTEGRLLNAVTALLQTDNSLLYNQCQKAGCENEDKYHVLREASCFKSNFFQSEHLGKSENFRNILILLMVFFNVATTSHTFIG